MVVVVNSFVVVVVVVGSSCPFMCPNNTELYIFNIRNPRTTVTCSMLMIYSACPSIVIIMLATTKIWCQS